MAGRKPAHRPHKFTPENVDRVLEGIRSGLPIHLACSAAGVAETQFYEWQRGEYPRGSDKRLKEQFQEELTRAKGESALRNIDIISKAANADWRAAAWILERRFPQDFGKQALEITGADGGPIQIQAAQMQRVILQALERHPDARITVAEALLELEKGSDA